MTVEITREPIEFDFIRSLVDRDDATLLEIGANNGGTTRLFAQTFPEAVIHCFEPDPRAIAKWRARKFPDRLRLWETAIGSTTGRVTFHMSDGREERVAGGWDLSGSIRRPTGHLDAYPTVLFNRTIDVPVVRLDDWAAENSIDIVDFIWADVQGAEIDLINGGMTTISRSKYLYTEYNNKELYEGQINLDQIMQILPDFEITRLYKDDVLLKNTRI